MTYQCFDFSIDQKIAHLRFNRPDSLNTMQPVFSASWSRYCKNYSVKHRREC
jgi:enoyl-CoA hydratase/carnithine racemase